MMYDEAFEVRIDNKKFFAFSKYKKMGYSTKSICHKTFPGWVHHEKTPDNANWGCYHGVKDGGSEEDENELESTLDLVQLEQKTYTPEDDVVAKGNVDPKFANKKLSELHRMGGQNVVEHWKALKNQPPHPQALLQEEEDVSDLPKHFDWRNVNGENFVNPVMNQGSCGSCYATSSLDAIASRVRIQTKNKVKPHYSIATCSSALSTPRAAMAATASRSASTFR